MLRQQRYIPKGAVKVSDKLSDAVAYLTEAKGVPYAQVYFGKQTKPVANYRYRTLASREAEVRRMFEARQASMAYTAKVREERKAWTNTFKVGDIVNTCWGYDQTNREFYEIVGVNKKHVTLRQIAVARKATGWCQEQVVPLKGEFVGEPFTRLASERGVKIGKHSFTYASRTSYTEQIPGIRTYQAGHTSSYA